MALGDSLLSPMDLPVDQVTTGPNVGNVQENKSKWMSFLANFNDPNVRQAMFQTGINLMRSPQYGQNSGDIAANALGTGAATLQALREQDRKRALEAQDRKIAEEQRGVDNSLKTRQVTATESNAAAYSDTARAQVAQGLASGTRADKALDETIRSNMSQEEINRIRAKADLERAQNSGIGGGKVAADIQKINMLSAQYQAEGMDETAARARAVMVIESQGKSKTPGEAARMIWGEKMKAWQNDINNLGKSLTQQQIQSMLEDSIQDALRLDRLDKGARGEPPPVSDTQGVITRPGEKDPILERKIGVWLKSGASPEQVKQLITENKGDPKTYGY